MVEKKSLSLIIPAYNEEKGIRGAILENRKVLSESFARFEIIVVDDGSRDATLRAIEEAASGVPEMRWHSQKNGGFGSAVRRGIGLARMDYVMFAPVDSPLTRDVLDAFLAHLGEADVLVSYRVSREGYSPRMKANSSVYHFLISALFGLSLKDYNWIHMYKRAMFDHDVQIENGGIFMLAEVLIKAHRKGYTFSEFPVAMRARQDGSATAASFTAAWRTARDMLEFYWRTRKS
jgi:glycosyltransferase involved in cell wall biosynthesis